MSTIKLDTRQLETRVWYGQMIHPSRCSLHQEEFAFGEDPRKPTIQNAWFQEWNMVILKTSHTSIKVSSMIIFTIILLVNLDVINVWAFLPFRAAPVAFSLFSYTVRYIASFLTCNIPRYDYRMNHSRFYSMKIFEYRQHNNNIRWQQSNS
jgi:hypothetical protein